MFWPSDEDEAVSDDDFSELDLDQLPPVASGMYSIIVDESDEDSAPAHQASFLSAFSSSSAKPPTVSISTPIPTTSLASSPASLSSSHASPSPSPLLASSSPSPLLASPSLASTASPSPSLASTASPSPSLASTASPSPSLASTASPSPSLAPTASPLPVSTPAPSPSSSPSAQTAPSPSSASSSSSSSTAPPAAVAVPKDCWGVRVLRVDQDFRQAVGIARSPLAEPRPGQIVVKLSACSINPVDWKLGSNYYNYADLFLTAPFTLGYDFAGEVVNSNGSQRLKVGDRVYGCTPVTKPGSFAEYLVVDESAAAIAPSNLWPLHAAALPLVGLVSLQALRAGRLQKGAKVLILGGAGGTGIVGCQLAKAMQAALVVVTCSAAKGPVCLSYGADRFVSTDTDDWTVVLRGQQFDVIYDCVGGRDSWLAAGNPDLNLLRPDGWYVTIAGDKQEPQTVTRSVGIVLTTFGRKFMSLLPKHPNYTFITCERSLPDLDQLRRYAEEGKIQPHLDRVMSPWQAVDALAYSATGRVTGKIVLDLTQSWETPS